PAVCGSAVPALDPSVDGHGVPGAVDAAGGLAGCRRGAAARSGIRRAGPRPERRRLGVERRGAVAQGEGHGLKPATLRAADEHVVIPMAGGVDSLNVAAASAVVFWQRRAMLVDETVDGR